MPFAPSPTDGSIPTDLVLLAAERAVTVTCEEHHQDVLSGRTGRAVVELRPCLIASGKHAGQDGLEVVLDGRRVGELTRLMAQRYRPMVDHLTARGYRAGCEAFLQDDARGTQVELRLPAGPTTAGLPITRLRPFAPSPAPAPTPTTDRSARRTAAAAAGSDDRHPAPADNRDHDPARTRTATVSPRALGGGPRRSGLYCSPPPSATPPGTTSRPPSRHCRPRPRPRHRPPTPLPSPPAPVTGPTPADDAVDEPVAAPAPTSTARARPPAAASKPVIRAPAATSKPAPRTVEPAPKPAPTAKPEPKPSGCDPNYSGCVPIARDVDCAGGSGDGPAYVEGPVRVIGEDIYGLDRGGEPGVGCE